MSSSQEITCISCGLALLFFALILKSLWNRLERRNATISRSSLDGSDVTLQDVLPADRHLLSRSAWVIRLASHFKKKHSNKYNVLVINSAIEKVFTPDHVVEEFRATYETEKPPYSIVYEVYVFDKGSLVNLGDGGYDNWCFLGNYDRMGMSVSFDVVQ
jgi:hypothetical protein